MTSRRAEDINEALGLSRVPEASRSCDRIVLPLRTDVV